MSGFFFFMEVSYVAALSEDWWRRIFHDFWSRIRRCSNKTEFAIIQVYRERPDLIDGGVDCYRVVNPHLRFTSTRKINLLTPQGGLSQQVASSVQQMCEWRLGRVTLPDAQDPPVAEVLTPQTPNEIVDCLKRIQSSIRLWTKKGGRQDILTLWANFSLDLVLNSALNPRQREE